MRLAKLDFPDEYPCPVCGELREMKPSKKRKPYFFCDPCGVQVFIRGKLGISRLSDIKNNSELWDKIHSLTITDSCNLIRLIHRINLVKSEIEKIEENVSQITEEEFEARSSGLSKKLNHLEVEYYALLSASPETLPSGSKGV